MNKNIVLGIRKIGQDQLSGWNKPGRKLADMEEIPWYPLSTLNYIGKICLHEWLNKTDHS